MSFIGAMLPDIEYTDSNTRLYLNLLISFGLFKSALFNLNSKSYKLLCLKIYFSHLDYLIPSIILE